MATSFGVASSRKTSHRITPAKLPSACALAGGQRGAEQEATRGSAPAHVRAPGGFALQYAGDAGKTG
jgi:hypothetical protein